MRPALAATALATAMLLTACGGPDFTMAGLAGPENIAALDAAVRCDSAAALDLAQRASASDQPSEALFGQFTQAAIFTDTGQTARAEAAVATAFDDPEMNPDGGSTLQQMQQGADALLETIRQRRVEQTGRPTC